MTTFPVRRAAEWPAIILVIVGLLFVQALIGGRVLLFTFPGYCVVGLAALFGLFAWPRLRVSPDPFCLGTAALFGGYVLLRASLTPGYYARADLFAIMAVFVIYGLTVTVVTSSTARLVVCCSLLSFGLVHVLIGLIQFSRGDNFMLFPFLQRADYGQRASGFYVCPNHLAGLLEVLGIFGLSLACFARWPIWSKLLVGYATLTCYAGVVITGSRGGYLSVMVSLAAFGAACLFVARGARLRSWAKFAAIGLLIFAVILAGGWALIRQSGFLDERARNLIDMKNMRLILWRAALEQWELQPVWGTGAGSYRFFGRQFRTPDMQDDPIDVHNDYLHLLCEYGSVGAAAFLLFFCAHLRKGCKTLRRLGESSANQGGTLQSNRLALQLGAFGAIAAYVAHSVVDFNLHIPANAMLLAFVFGLVAKPTGSRSSEPVRGSTWIPLIVAAAFGLVLIVQSVRLLRGEILAERSRINLRDENPEASLAFAESALAHDREKPELYFYIGRACLAMASRASNESDRSSFYQRSAQAFQEAERLVPLDGTYPLDLAFVYDLMGLFNEAEKAFDRARLRDPHSKPLAQLYQAHLRLKEQVPSTREPNQ